MFRTSLIIGIAVAFVGFLISSNTANADTYTGCLTHYGFLVKVKEGPKPKRPCSSRRRETEITFGMGVGVPRRPRHGLRHIEFATADAAKAFQASQGLREAMQRGGVQGQPRMLVVNKT